MVKYDICVIGGCGHVGLPLSLVFADKGKKVIIFDKDKTATETIGRGMMPFMENGAETILKRVVNKNLFLSNDPIVIKDSKFVIVVIGTPFDNYLNPMDRHIMESFKELKRFMRKDQIVILRSTVGPGMTKKIHEFLKKCFPGIKVCYCPERIAEGNAIEELLSLPQIVSGFDKQSILKVSRLFSLLTKDIIHLGPLEAEMTKLFTNSWRYIQFAIANQFYMISEEKGADFCSIYNAMTHNYHRAKGLPRPGFAAGPCLFKDTMHVSTFTNNQFSLGHSAMLINEGLPNFIIDQLKKHYDLSKKIIGILGMAFKAESDDDRESLSYKLKILANWEAKGVLCSDVYIKNKDFIDEKTLIKKSDIIIIGAPHKKYQDLNFKGKILVDTWKHIPL